MTSKDRQVLRILAIVLVALGAICRAVAGDKDDE